VEINAERNLQEFKYKMEVEMKRKGKEINMHNNTTRELDALCW
jgi:hypothetical protein